MRVCVFESHCPLFFEQILVNYTTAGEYDLTSQWGQIVDAIIHLAILSKGSFDIMLVSCLDCVCV